jgi:hypothetical protein
MSTTQPARIQVRPTSRDSAECGHIVLRVNKTDTARLVFKPIMVHNEANPTASIDGDFVYEKKLANNASAALSPGRVSGCFYMLTSF